MTTTWTQLRSLGTELITNGGFVGSAAGWTLGLNWAYGSTNVVHTPGSDEELTQVLVTLTPNATFDVSFDITVSAGDIELETDFGGINFHSDEYTTSGTKTFTVYSGGDTSTPGDRTILFNVSNDFDGTVTNVSIKQVNPNAWTDIPISNIPTYTDIPKPTNGSTIIYGGQPIGLLMALTYANTVIIGGDWIKIPNAT